jgi:hypothetical protein
MDQGLGDRGSVLGKGKILLFSIASRPALGLTQPPIQWVPGVKRPGSEADHSPPSSIKMKNGGAVLPLPRVSSWHSAKLIKHRNNFFVVVAKLW